MDISLFREMIDSALKFRRNAETLEDSVGKSIKAFREHNGLTQEKMATDLGVTKQYLHDIERGRRGVSQNMLLKLHDYRPSKTKK